MKRKKTRFETTFACFSKMMGTAAFAYLSVKRWNGKKKEKPHLYSKLGAKKNGQSSFFFLRTTKKCFKALNGLFKRFCWV